jgi:hypothetical protein
MAHWEKAIAALRKFKTEWPTLIGNEMVNYALDNIEVQRDVHGAPLKPRKSTAPRNAGRNILVDKGDGRRSIRVSKKTSKIIEVTANDYMEAHNVGATITSTARVRAHRRTRAGRSENVSSHTRKMNTKLPERTFLAPSETLNRRIVDVLITRFKQLTK